MTDWLKWQSGQVKMTVMIATKGSHQPAPKMRVFANYALIHTIFDLVTGTRMLLRTGVRQPGRR